MSQTRMPPTPLKRVPPGAFGHNRGVVRPNYAVIQPEGPLRSRLPGWDGTAAFFLAAPALGAGFAQLILAMEPGGGTAAPVSAEVQHFLYVLSGSVTLGLDGVAHALEVGDYAYIPPGTAFTLRNGGGEAARVLALKKRWEEAPGLQPPPAFTGRRDDAAVTNHTGYEGRGFLHLTGFGDMRHDFEMNLMFFEPGTCFPAVETHIMEHGLFMLEGQGLYFLGDEWHEVWAGDFIWMGPFCPQQFYPTGQERTVYLLYKNMNRDVAL